jgi:hypothetical protein
MSDHGRITKNLTVRRLAYKTGLRLMRIEYIRRAVQEHADLTAFNHRLPARLIAGLLLISVSNLICWPGISVLSGLAIRDRAPLLLALGGPIIYGITFLCSVAGMVWCSGKDARVFFRWRVRRWVDWLLAHGERV